VTNVEVLRVVLSIGPTEAMHFQTWQDKAGNAPALTDPKDPSLVFPNLNAPPFGGEDFQTNLIMPNPLYFSAGSSRHAPSFAHWHKGGCHGSPQVSHCYGTLPGPVEGVLCIYD